MKQLYVCWRLLIDIFQDGSRYQDSLIGLHIFKNQIGTPMPILIPTSGGIVSIKSDGREIIMLVVKDVGGHLALSYITTITTYSSQKFKPFEMELITSFN
ncbi:MAG: hypothetical protein COU22_03590 [Candidatus Komeilibacteria bacterium CG10_big_fil_rev_8_21_14_0_10_41_13]|uniref:Uncharacterized protein n=1 Tax=Candidatus Komeilibacteria bacterium CG10_big_fil_rev_8_21_14_0_10_41_13 TaxID=1974476 RepID=A0A2M6WBP5_9BACT|nr:MAG: hypothetical protein COU22_03590 [Candidatus Komeilibacteria bacterium CG10_big_fil_rev_8_21_14_0_10_41_13]